MSTENSQPIPQKTDQTINIFVFATYLLAYLSVNLFLLMATSSGFIMFTYMFIVSLIYLATAFVVFLICLILNYFHRSELPIYKYFGLLIIFLQILLSLFNVGDCANGSGKAIGNFVQRIIFNSDPCYNSNLENWIPNDIVFLALQSNYYLLLIFIVFSLLSAKKPTKTGV